MRIFTTFILLALSLIASATDYDQNKPFGFCTRLSRTDAAATFNVTGGGCYTYPLAESFTGKVTVLKSNGQDMKRTIENAVKQNDVIIFDGAQGDFIVSSNVSISASNKTLLGINNARLCTQWSVTQEIIEALNKAGVPNMSTSSGTGGILSNGHRVGEEAEYQTRQIIINMTNDAEEKYRSAGVLTLFRCQNIIIRNLKFVGPGSIDVGGSDLLSCRASKNCWIDHCDFTDGMDGNFDITQSSDFNTVSWCTFSYTERSYMHQNTNLIGYSDREPKGFLNTTYAFNWWGSGCVQRMDDRSTGGTGIDPVSPVPSGPEREESIFPCGGGERLIAEKFLPLSGGERMIAEKFSPARRRRTSVYRKVSTRAADSIRT